MNPTGPNMHECHVLLFNRYAARLEALAKSTGYSAEFIVTRLVECVLDGMDAPAQTESFARWITLNQRCHERETLEKPKPATAQEIAKLTCAMFADTTQGVL